MLGVVAIAGLPPLGIFMSEFLVVTSTFVLAPWLAVLLGFGILIALGGLFLRLNTIAFGEPRGPAAPAQASYVPMFAHLAIVFMAGIYLPPAPVAGFKTSPGCWDSAGPRSTASRISKRPRSIGRPRAVVGVDSWGRAIDSWRRGSARCSGCGVTPARCTWRCSMRVPAKSSC